MTSDLEKVAEAICAAEGYFWPDQFSKAQEIYRRLAQAAMDALLSPVTRIDIVQDSARQREHWADSWELSVQDHGKTLKLFALGDGDKAKDQRDAALAERMS